MYVPSIAEQVKPGNVIVTVGRLESGFEFPSLRLVTLTDLELYGAEKERGGLCLCHRQSQAFRVYRSQAGDYVVHIAHGIGSTKALSRWKLQGQRDYLMIRYAGEDKRSPH